MAHRACTLSLFLALFALLIPDGVGADRRPDRPPPTTREHWVELAPPARAEHVAVYDASRGRMVVFGGQVDHAPRNDVWTLSLDGTREWTHVTPSGAAPSPRYGAAAALDPSGERMFMFGGRDTLGNLLGDFWELTLRGRMSWRRIAIPEPAPYPRYHHTLTLDPEHGSLVMIGDWGLWRYSLSERTWSEIDIAGGPGILSKHIAVHSADLKGILVFGGHTTEGYATNRIWLLTTGNAPSWSERTPRGLPAPCGLEGHAAIYDIPGHQMVVMGGGALQGPCSELESSFWSLDIPSFKWTRLALVTPAPHARVNATAVMDSENGRLVLYGGQGSLTGGACNADTWELPLEQGSTWRLVTPEREIPDFGINARAFYDRESDRMVAYDGSTVWEYPFPYSGWRPLTVSGAIPPARVEHAVTHDTRRNQIVVYGGINDRINRVPLTDAWSLTLSGTPTWSRLPAEAGPRTRSGAAIYDPVRDRVLLMPASYDHGLWALSMNHPAAWESLTAQGPNLGGRTRVSLIYDPDRDRAVLFGGGSCEFSPNDLWALQMTPMLEWKLLSPFSMSPDTPPGMSLSKNAVLDPVHDRMILTGSWYSGCGFGTEISPDVIGTKYAVAPTPPAFLSVYDYNSWAFSFESNSWSRLTQEGGPRPDWFAAAGVFDSKRSRVVMTQGDLFWALEPRRDRGHYERRVETHPQEEDHAIGPSFALTLAEARPHPAGPGSMIEFSLADADVATLQLFYLAGRRVWTRNVAELGPGNHRLALDGGHHLSAGIYLVKLSSGTRRLTRKVVCVE